MDDKIKIVFFGVGPVGGTIGGWVAGAHDNCVFVDQPRINEALRANGITLYEEDKKKQAKTIKVDVADDLAEVESPDVIVVAVKNYSLDAVSRMIRDKVGDTCIVLGLQNGMENQVILPKYFSSALYGVVCYNTWMDEPGVYGYQKRGPLVVGTPDNTLRFESRAVARVFNRGVETVAVDHFQDAVLSKMIINLTNSLTTLVGHTFREISDPGLFQKLLANLTHEGVRIVKAAGHKECKLGGMPPWWMLEAAAKLPTFITRPMFKANLKKMVVSSMAQDVIQRGSRDNELESLNGRFLQMAAEHGVDAPYNKAVYELCGEEFAKPRFEPIDVKDVWARVEKYL